jgi:uncharacterized protein YgfB (UPF0149 family)
MIKIDNHDMNNSSDHYSQLETVLAETGLEISPSEVHGTIVGAMANHMKSGHAPDLIKHIEPQSESGDSRFESLQDLLNDLYRDVSEQLLEAKESFDLLLPDEDESLDVRVEGLATWSKGYLLGLLYNDAFSIDQLPENGSEIARDLIQIAEAAVGSGTEHEEDWALAELHEYVKVGSQLIFEFIYSERATAAPSAPQ